jgi:putative heme-binding domain-containing protein
MPGAWQLHEREVEQVAAYVRSLGAVPPEAVAGNAERGARAFETLGCGACHIIAGKGEGFGPELSTIGARRNAAHLRKTILTPASSLPEGFAYLSLTPAAGERVRGVRVNEDTFTIQVKDAAGQFHSLRKSELKELLRLDGQTPMPSYQGRIAPGDLDDLVAYLAGLRGKL